MMGINQLRWPAASMDQGVRSMMGINQLRLPAMQTRVAQLRR